MNSPAEASTLKITGRETELFLQNLASAFQKLHMRTTEEAAARKESRETEMMTLRDPREPCSSREPTWESTEMATRKEL